MVPEQMDQIYRWCVFIWMEYLSYISWGYYKLGTILQIKCNSLIEIFELQFMGILSDYPADSKLLLVRVGDG